MQHSRTQRKCSGNKRQTSSWAMPNRCFYQKKQRELPLIQACTCQRRFPGNGQSSLERTRRRKHCTVTAAFFALNAIYAQKVSFVKCFTSWVQRYVLKMWHTLIQGLQWCSLCICIASLLLILALWLHSVQCTYYYSLPLFYH